MQAACHDSGGTIIALCSADHGSSFEQTERRESFGLFMLTVWQNEAAHRSQERRWVMRVVCAVGMVGMVCCIRGEHA
jgi:hypothetical protein